ncbi:replication protein [Enterococcus gallinarum]|uniref:Rep family protein n=1 Tax=Enterococcus gallinarum TaxID=1353 RepID=UPI001928E557
MTREKRATKWAFIIYKESTPSNYLDILEQLHVPFVLSPWHDRDIDKHTGTFKKAHKHGAFFFDSLKSYSQVSELIHHRLNGPTHVEPVISPTGMYNYFTHAENKEKTLYNIQEIESGCGFDLNKFVVELDSSKFIYEAIDVIERNNFTEFEELVWYARANNGNLLGLIIERAYFFAKYLDSRRYNKNKRGEINDERTK